MPNERGANPANGIRLHLTLTDSDATSARYDAEVFAPTETYRFSVAVSSAAEIYFTTVADSPVLPETLTGFVTNVVRGIAKSTLAETNPQWPRKITRWRDKA